MINHKLSPIPGHSHIRSLTRSSCLLLVLLAVCGKIQAATTAFDADTGFAASTGTATFAADIKYIPNQGNAIWTTDIIDGPGVMDLQMDNATPTETRASMSPDTPSRLSFFYILGTAVIVALLVELFSKKDT